MAAETSTSPPIDSKTNMPSGKLKVDAGLLPRDHYKVRLPPWRYKLRQRLLPLVRWETPYLAWLQDHVRTPFFDQYFAMSANLGTHTFFMAALPLLFWFAYIDLGRGIVHVLATGVFFSGMLKDLICLPRPLSPPLHRISMSGSAALEYGFPSTHSTNAVSVALYSLLYLNQHRAHFSTSTIIISYVMAAIYTISILFGRLYCGMHGFLDVVIGSILGVILALVQWVLHDQIDALVYTTSHWPMVWLVLIILLLVRLHPEPADSCPCFDDGVAFAAVIAGIEIACHRIALSSLAWHWDHQPSHFGYSSSHLGPLKSTARVIIGVAIIFLWREVAKPTLHTLLPPLFRLIEKANLSQPRAHFLQASEYNKVPRLDDDILPSLDKIPSLVREVRRGRKDSVGPQSAADAYETLAYREKRRRESVGNMDDNAQEFRQKRGERSLSRTRGLDVEKYERQMGASANGNEKDGYKSEQEREEDEEREMLRKIEPFKPRVRYDVEVVTKLVVYAGIAWWALEGCGRIFEATGLGAGAQGLVV